MRFPHPTRRGFLAALAGAPVLLRDPDSALVAGPWRQWIGRDRFVLRWLTAAGEPTDLLTGPEDALAVHPARRTLLRGHEIGWERDLDLHEAELDLRAGRLAVRLHHPRGPLMERLWIDAPREGKLRFLAFGDSGSGGVEQRLLAARMAERDADFWLHTGDMAYPEGTFAELVDHHFRMYGDQLARTPLFPCLGNHDVATAFGRPNLLLHAFPECGVPLKERGYYYSFDWQQAHVVVMDSTFGLHWALHEGGAMLDWLKQDLAQSRAPWKIAVFHHAPFVGGKNTFESLCINTRENLVPVLENAGVQLVLAGHEHNYQRAHLRGTTLHIATGGGGGELYPVTEHPAIAFNESRHHFVEFEIDGPTLRGWARGLDGEPFDEFHFDLV